MLTLRQISKTIPPKDRISYYIEMDGYYDYTDKKTFEKATGRKFKIDKVKRYFDTINLIKEIMSFEPIVHIFDINHDIVIEYRQGELKINISSYPHIVSNEILAMIKPKLPVDREELLRSILRYVPVHYHPDIVKNVAVHTFAIQEFSRIKNIVRQYYITGEEEGDSCSPFDAIEDAFISTIQSRLKT